MQVPSVSDLLVFIFLTISQAVESSSQGQLLAWMALLAHIATIITVNVYQAQVLPTAKILGAVPLPPLHFWVVVQQIQQFLVASLQLRLVIPSHRSRCTQIHTMRLKYPRLPYLP